MVTLIIHPLLYTTELKLKGLSIKAMGQDGRHLLKDESGYYLSNDMHLNNKTAMIELEYLVSFLKLVYKRVPFDRIKLRCHYELTAEELMNRIINH